VGGRKATPRASKAGKTAPCREGNCWWSGNMAAASLAWSKDICSAWVVNAGGLERDGNGNSL